MTDAISRLEAVQNQINVAARDVGRDPASVQLIAVSKTFDEHAIRPVLAAGHRAFGENRVQEAAGKWPALRRDYSDVELHLIGPLQSNKTRDALAIFDAIHTVDRDKIAKSIAVELARQPKPLQLYVQVNTGEEEQKAGIGPTDAVAFVQHCRTEHGLALSGLTCIPPVDEEPAVHFALLSKLAEEAGLEKLSMGMSGDFETAIQFGATSVRVGSAIFGARA